MIKHSIMKKSKATSIRNTYEILHHNKKDLRGTINHLSDETIDLILEIISNIVFNEKIIHQLKNKKIFNTLRKKIVPHKKEFINILTKKASLKKKKKFIIRQTGSGGSQILETIVSFLPTLLPFLLL